ncbi:hypothetical protein TRIATDRAFT_320809 [Trichoderma atroviride IMI 206040]|uniref:CorA-like transporter domain-containing protein n=1 Tax=Hypocrea atroviridis (strain ATCC 20476 / IMI 206040) TaxID=452589 RepID=G9P2U5_HYPAI|nr:uncharacterized protein TRIATDRAFT_320809 [Trichoderma atroviride IMI 206040]EHK43559.1 hypothetical protein TRIATDRAFT_320809 [Trichoderma atroviride IMI 206040]
MSMHDVFPHFLETVQAFGLRTKDGDNTWSNFHFRKLMLEEGHQICYTVRFVELNHRDIGDPWSPRQMGVYQRFHAPTQRTVWVMIKPPQRLRDIFEEKISAIHGYKPLANAQFLLFHLAILSFSLVNWGEYVAAQRKNLEKYEGTSFFSDVDCHDVNDYKLGFEDRQNLQRFRRKLIKATAIIDAAILLGEKMKGFMERVAPAGLDITIQETIGLELEDYLSEANYHRECLIGLQQRAVDTATLLLDILQRRQGNTSLRSAVANEAAVRTMMNIAVMGEMEHEVEKKTAVNIRALTFVATLYLPASLLAGIFSSQLLIDNKEGTMAVSPELWKFIVVLIPMIAVTLALVLAFQSIWARDKHMNRLDEGREEAGVLAGA